MRPLLCREKHEISDESWSRFLNLKSHLDDFKATRTKNEDDLTSWQTIQLMSQATSKYSGVQENIGSIQEMLSRVMINSHTLTTPTLDPLGLYLDPLTALLNHSCTPNACLVFDGNNLNLRSLIHIPADTELSISYIDTTNSTQERRQELQSRYFFTCKCLSCTKDLTNGAPDQPDSAHRRHIVERVFNLQKEASVLPLSDSKAKFDEAVSLLRAESFPITRQPYPALLHSCFLAAVAFQDWISALRSAVQIHRHIGLKQYHQSHHPVNVVRNWVLLRLVVHIAGLASENDQKVMTLRRAGVNYMLISVSLWRQVSGDAEKSHGSNSQFARHVAAFGQDVGIAGQVVDIHELTNEWTKLSKAIGIRE